MKIARWVVLALVFVTARAEAQRYFGMNQVEYRHLRWQVLETEHFYVHYYPEESVAAHDAARLAERSYERLSRVLGHQFREKKPILLFASRADFAQNNVTGDLGEGTGGVTDASRQRIMLPFTGDYTELQHVLTHEMVHQFQYDVFAHGRAGDNLQLLEQVNPPLWVMEGMAEYLSLGPNHTLTTTWVRDAVVNGNLPTIKQMTREPEKYFPYRYGEALWRYIGERWGDAVIGAILQSIATNGIERGFQRELGLTLEQLSDQWREATRAQYLPQLANMERVRDFAQPLLNHRRSNGSIFLGPVLSPDGRTIAYLANGSEKRGEIFIDLWLGDAHTGKPIRRLIRSTTNPSFEELRLLYSQGSFSPDGRYFAFTAQTGGRDVLSIIDVRTGDVRQLKDIPVDAVLSPSYAPDGQHFVFSGMTGGMTDLYIADIDGKNVRRLTQDRYADMQPAWSPDGKSIAFATDRASTGLTNLAVGKLQIAVMNVDNGTITVLPNQVGLNINPAWSPDGQTIAYISDRNGTPNIYVHSLQSNQDSQITNVQGGVSAITEYSPALTWSHGTGEMAFTYYDNNDYTIWSLANPLSLAKPIPAVATAPVTVNDTTTKPISPPPAPASGAVAGAPTQPAKDSTPGAVPADQMSVYRSINGSRPSSQAPSSTETQSDSNMTVSVAALMSDPNTGLPDTLTFKKYPYSVRFTPDYIAGGSIGIAGGSYGTAFMGGTEIVFTDLTGDHELAVGAGIYGRLSDADLLVGYADLSHRLQYNVGATQNIQYLYSGYNQDTLPNNGLRQQYIFTRYAFRSASISAAYPLNRFVRFELGASLNWIGRSLVAENDDILYDAFYGYYENIGFQNLETLQSYTYLAPTLAFVTDNTLPGATGPITGRRMRASVSPTLGNVHWTDYALDYRRYDPVIFNTLTFATRFFGDLTVGRDDSLFPKYIGTPDFVRGYDQASFYSGYACESYLGGTNVDGRVCATAQLVGTRVAVFNEELRFPIIRRFDFGSLPIGLPPVDGELFYDAGLAWNAGQSVSLVKPKNYDYTLQRYVMQSYGAGIRVNLFNLILLRWDYARPLNRDGDNKWNWTFSLGPSF